MRPRSVLLGLAALVCSACYRVTVVTGAQPSTQTVDRPWQKSFVYGLVPPPEIDAKQQCAQGFAVVETERSFLNGLVSVLTYSIFTPMHAKVTCASGPPAK
jgi:Bor protein